jgi:hypothetical protein
MIETVKRELLMSNLPVVANELPVTTMNNMAGNAFSAGTNTCRNAPTSSGYPSFQPPVSAQQATITSENWYTNCYSGFAASAPAYLVAKLSYFSRNNYRDLFDVWDNSGGFSAGIPLRAGNLKYEFKDFEPLSDTFIFVNASELRWSQGRILAPGNEISFQQLDVNPLGYNIIQVNPLGFGLNPAKVSENTNFIEMNMNTIIVDPSAALLSANHSYQISISLSNGTNMTLSKTSLSTLANIQMPKNQFMKIAVTRLAGAAGAPLTATIAGPTNDIGKRNFSVGLLPGGSPVPSVVAGGGGSGGGSSMDFPYNNNEVHGGNNLLPDLGNGTKGDFADR